MESFMVVEANTLYVINRSSSWTCNQLIKVIALDYPIKGFFRLTSNLQPALTEDILIEGNGLFSGSETSSPLKRVADKVSFHWPHRALVAAYCFRTLQVDRPARTSSCTQLDNYNIK